MEMVMGFIVDVGVGRTVEQWLLKEGYRVLSIREVDPEMEDEQILQLAVEENAIIITMDKDFGELIYKGNRQHKGVLLLRLDDAVAEEKLAVIQTLIPDHIPLININFAVFQNGKLRVRYS